jgi:DNA-binding IclR family transcriptional regulator
MPGYQYVQSVQRALDILEMVAGTGGRLSLNYLALATNLNIKTTHNLLRTLVHRGYLTKTSSPPVYKLGPVLEALPQQHALWANEVLLPSVGKSMKLAKKAGAIVTVNGYAGGEVLCRFVAKPWGGEVVTSVCYANLPAYGTALVHQAFMSEQDLSDYRSAHPMDDKSLTYWKSPDMVDRLLKRIRTERHVAFAKDGVFRVAAPVLAADGGIAASMSLTRALAGMAPGDARRCVDLLRQTTRELSSRLVERYAQAGRP